jgi:carbon storage regulator
MLVLSRFINEKIYIGDDVVIQVVSVRGDKVKIGVEAPADIKVMRAELVDEQEGE